SRASLTNADLCNADISYADLSGAWLRGSFLVGVDAIGVSLDGVGNITQQQLNTIRYHRGHPPINLPAGLTLPEPYDG
ncbi:MAG: pentapeptide repeat-containing protein, partial [Pseudomonadota bacterium]